MDERRSGRPVELAMWHGMVLGVLAALSADERSAFEEWERRHVDGSGRYATSDWPRLRRYLPPRPTSAPQHAPRKKPIPRSLRTQVFERDAYRCQRCGTHVDLTCDHVMPEALGGEATLANLRTLCQSCNSRKGAT